MDDTLIPELLFRSAWGLPFLAVKTIGLVLSLRAIARAPHIAKPAAMGFGLLLVNSIAALFDPMLRAAMDLQHSPEGMKTYARFAMALGATHGLVDLAAWILLLIALHRTFQLPTASGQT